MREALALAEMSEIDHRVRHPPTNAFFFEGMSLLQHWSEACQGVLHSTASTLDLLSESAFLHPALKETCSCHPSLR